MLDSGSDDTDRITRFGSLAVTGLVEGASWQYSLDSGSNWVFGVGTALSLTGDGGKSIMVRQVDATGTESSNDGAVFRFTLDTTLVSPTLSSPAGLTNVSAVGVAGIESGATWQYSVDGGSQWRDGSGGSFILAEGNYAANVVRVQQTDIAGNSAMAMLGAITVDSTAPLAPSLSLQTVKAVTDYPVSNSGALLLTDVEPGATVQYSIDDQASWTSAFLAKEGYNLVIARQTDMASNASPTSASYAFILDTVAPAKLTLSLAQDTGSSASDNITSNGSLLLGAAESGATVAYSSDGGINWSSDFALAEGVNAVQVRQTDVAGNVSPAADYSFTLDTSAAPPTLALKTDTGVSKTDNITSNAALVLGAEPGATVEYSEDNYNWQPSFVLTEGVNNVYLRQTDVAGNLSSSSRPYQFMLDNTVAKLALSLVTDSGVDGDKITNVGALNLDGYESGAVVQYSKDGGTWNSTFTPVQGANALMARQTDLAGNVSAVSAVFSFNFDTAVAMPGLTLAKDTGPSATDLVSNFGTVNVGGVDATSSWKYSLDGGTSWNDGSGKSFDLDEGLYAANAIQVQQTDGAGNTSTIAKMAAVAIDNTVLAPSISLLLDTGVVGDDLSSSGSLALTGQEAGATTQYSLDGGKVWSASFKAVEGGNTVWARQTDLAGNVSAASDPYTFTLDTKLAVPTLALANDTGPSAIDRVTSDRELVLTGVEDVATLAYSLNGGGRWTDSFAPNEGVNALQVRQTDVAGNVALSATLNFTLDTTVAAPTLALAEDTGTGGADGITSKGGLILGGAEQGAFVEYSDDAFNWRPTWTLSEGNNTVVVRQTDLAGNVSPPSAGYKFTLDTSVEALTLSLRYDTGVDGDGITANPKLSFEGLETAASVQYSIDNGSNWTSSFAAKAGLNAVQARQTDLAGNVSAPSGVFSFTFEPGSGTGSADLLAYTWKAHSLLDSVSVGSSSTQDVLTDNRGAAGLTGISGATLSLTASRTVATESAITDAAVNLQDAIAILKMIVGLDVNGAGKLLSPYQAYAADFDGNGKVELSDAINVLKHVVGLTSPDPQWLFFNENVVPLDVTRGANLNPGNPPAISVDSSAVGQLHVGLVGVLRGDVDGSFGGAPGSLNLDLLQPSYIHDLALQPGLNLSQFGVYGS
jgi:hypothetical protein